MACFVAPLTAALIATTARKRVNHGYHLSWLLALLWGGSAWLVLEHAYHGEIMLNPPFFTAGLGEVASEILAVGVPQVAAAIGVWGILIAVSSSITKRTFKPSLVGLTLLGAIVMASMDLLLA